VDAGGGTASCSITSNNGGGSGSGSCSSLEVSGLKPSTSYTFTVSAKNAAGTTTKTKTQTTDVLFGTATCHNGQSGDTATYCEDKPNARNGDEVFSVAEQDDNKYVGWAEPGSKLEAYCKKSGTSIDSYIYNNHKKSAWWIQVNFKGKNYIPWAWLNLDGGDDLDLLPTC
jgi:hypothetical protein